MGRWPTDQKGNYRSMDKVRDGRNDCNSSSSGLGCWAAALARLGPGHDTKDDIRGRRGRNQPQVGTATAGRCSRRRRWWSHGRRRFRSATRQATDKL